MPPGLGWDHCLAGTEKKADERETDDRRSIYFFGTQGITIKMEGREAGRKGFFCLEGGRRGVEAAGIWIIRTNWADTSHGCLEGSAEKERNCTGNWIIIKLCLPFFAQPRRGRGDIVTLSFLSFVTRAGRMSSLTL